MESKKSNRKAVYQIIRQPEGKKPIWQRVGIAFVNRDLSLNVKLNSMPTNGELHIRDFATKDDSAA
ncbi:MAG: hypothetical protein IT381_00240 [Deltaproteobacteria bacterium]|nr:hypothetical protein [Deltaproteobacteria bacterium]